MITNNFGGGRRERIVYCNDTISRDGRKVGGECRRCCYGCSIVVLVTCSQRLVLSLSNTGKRRQRQRRGRGRCHCYCDKVPGKEGRGRIVLGEYDGSTILVLLKSFSSSSSIDIFSRYILRRRHRIESSNSNSSLLFFLQYRTLPLSNRSIIPQQK